MCATLPTSDDAGVRGFRSDSYGDAFADVYDDWYAEITDLETTVGFVADLATAGGTRAGSVLELGVGTGRLALPLAGRVASVHRHRHQRQRCSTDSAQAGPSTGPSPRCSATWSTICPTGRHDVVFVAYNTLFNLTTAERQQACFDRVADGLAPGGSFVVEAFVPSTTPTDRVASQVTVRSMTADTGGAERQRARRRRRNAPRASSSRSPTPAACACARGRSAGPTPNSSTRWPPAAASRSRSAGRDYDRQHLRRRPATGM